MSGDVLREVQLVAELIEGNHLEEARRRLEGLAEQGHGRGPIVRVRRIHLALAEASLAPAAAMKELIEIMRADQHTPGAKEVYMKAAQLQHAEGHSSMAYSHPPPPPKP